MKYFNFKNIIFVCRGESKLNDFIVFINDVIKKNRQLQKRIYSKFLFEDYERNACYVTVSTKEQTYVLN